MKRVFSIGTMGMMVFVAGIATAQVAGKSKLGVTVIEMEAVVLGVSAQRDLLGKGVMNDNNERVGKVEDLILTPEQNQKDADKGGTSGELSSAKHAASFVIISTGGFLGVAKHDVAIPMNQIRVHGGRLVLPGATKDALQALPKFEYQEKRAQRANN
jgi:sporulation protein YlmC with PRC-barrel domain